MKRYLTVVVIDFLLLVALLYVAGDQQWRVAYAESPHSRTSGYATSFSYSLFTQVFTMSGKGVSLSSPLTLDWVQVLVAALFVVNAWFVYVTLGARRKKSSAVSVPVQPHAE